jgi:hypothetical protein
MNYQGPDRSGAKLLKNRRKQRLPTTAFFKTKEAMHRRDPYADALIEVVRSGLYDAT